jgi:hypothetical protein
MIYPRHCEEPNGSSERSPDDKLRDEAIQLSLTKED